jgi:hypothetical protein
MRNVLLWVVLPLCVLTAVLVFYWPSISRFGLWAKRAESLRAAAEGADRLVVEDLGFGGKARQPDVEICGADKVQELFALIDIDDANSGFHCMCDGEYWVHVYKGDEKVLTLGYHHGRSLRWHAGWWYEDGLLTTAAQEALPRWFEKNGCAWLQQLRERETARRKKAAEQRDKPGRPR